MPTAKRQRRAKSAAAPTRAKEEEDDEEMAAVDKENEANGGRKGRRGSKRKPAQADDDEVGEEDEGAAGANDNDAPARDDDDDAADAGDDAPPTPKRPKKERGKKPSKKKRPSRAPPPASSAASSPLRDRHVNPPGSGPAEAGIIHEVYVENFMCHRKLSVKLCRNVNFIHGQNGSGKSAILAAVQVCLGAGARRTHRARNLRDLVRKEAGENCPGAKLRVTLLNKGADGYKPDVYGDYVTVERVISLRAGGFNGYKLLDQDGKERSRAKKDLDAMLDQLNIQVENPVAVLDQEEAKKFLMGKAEDKYEFFMKATELERLDRSYANVADSIVEQREMQQRARDNIAGAIENTRALKKEWEQFRELDKLELDLQEQRANFGWSLHMEFGEQLNEEAKKSQKFSRALEKRRADLVTAEQSLNFTDDEETALNDRLAELTEEAQAAATSRTTLENEYKASQGPARQKEREREVTARELAQAKKTHKKAIQRLDRARKEILESQGNAAEEVHVRTRKIADTERDLAAAKEKVDPLKEEIAKYLSDYQDVSPALEQTKETTEGTEKQVRAVQNKLRAMQAEGGAGGRALAVFGSKCKPLYEAVQKAVKAKKFKGPVAGPVGMYVKVVDGKERFAQIAEAAIGMGALDRFVVTNQADLKLLDRLRKDVGCGPKDCPMYRISPRSTKEKYNVPNPPAGVETISSVLNVENAMAFNFLVDHCNIDTSALTESKEAGERALLVTNSNGRRSVRGKIRKVYFLPKGDFWDVDRAGNLGMVSNDRAMKKTIGVDRSAAIEATKHEMNALQQELARNKEEEKGVKAAAYKAKKAWNESQKMHQKLTTNINKMEATLDKLKAEAETSEEVQTIDTTDFEKDIEEAEAAVDDLKKREAAVVQEIRDLQPDVEEKRRALEEVTARNKKILDDIDKLEAKVEDIVKGQTRRQQEVDKVRAKVQHVEQGLAQQEEVVKEIQEKVAGALEGAKKLQYDFERERKIFDLKKDNNGEVPPGEEVPGEPTEQDLDEIEVYEVPKDSKYYKTKINAKDKKIAQEKERRNMSETDPAVARDKYYRAKKDLDSKMEQIDAIERNCKSLEKDLHHRKKRWGHFRRHIAEQTTLGFDEFLNKKGSTGEVEFDHESKKLDLLVQKDCTDEHSSQTKDVKALSGGERSYTTLSLLLAIGESIETPFRVMDEFDVFLDPVARKIAMRTLVEVAKEMDHRQFIFITPQDVSSLPTDSKLKIHKMKPPARSALVGGPQQQTLDFENRQG